MPTSSAKVRNGKKESVMPNHCRLICARNSCTLEKRCTRPADRERFLADADLNRAIVTGVLRREPSLDFLTAQVAGLRGMNDPGVLALAAERQPAVVSHDVGTMPAHFRAFRKAGKQSSGVLLVPQSLDVGAAIDELLLIWLASEAADWDGRLV